MSEILYSLEEAAQRLGMSETVLVRLSQYFKKPAIAYEADGFLSFKGDLKFCEPDLGFFQAVQDEILAGKSLEAIKKTLEKPLEKSIEKPVKHVQTQAFLPEIEMPPPTTALPAPPLNEIYDPAPLAEQAEEGFERYKDKNLKPEPQVFRHLADEMAPVQEEEPVPSFLPGLRFVHERKTPQIKTGHKTGAIIKKDIFEDFEDFEKDPIPKTKTASGMRKRMKQTAMLEDTSEASETAIDWARLAGYTPTMTPGLRTVALQIREHTLANLQHQQQQAKK